MLFPKKIKQDTFGDNILPQKDNSAFEVSDKTKQTLHVYVEDLLKPSRVHYKMLVHICYINNLLTIKLI